MSKKIGDLSREETENEIIKFKLQKRALKLRIATHKNGKNLKALERKKIKEEKARILSNLQNEINSATNKASKDQKRKNKLIRAKSFDTRILAKDNEIDRIKTDILNVERQIAEINFIVENLQHHLKVLNGK